MNGSQKADPRSPIHTGIITSGGMDGMEKRQTTGAPGSAAPPGRMMKTGNSIICTSSPKNSRI